MLSDSVSLYYTYTLLDDVYNPFAVRLEFVQVWNIHRLMAEGRSIKSYQMDYG